MHGEGEVTHVHINAPPSFAFRSVQSCGVCRAKRRFIMRLYEWYPATATCCGCGTTWSDAQSHSQNKQMKIKARDEARKAWPTAMTREQAIAKLTRYVNAQFRASRRTKA